MQLTKYLIKRKDKYKNMTKEQRKTQANAQRLRAETALTVTQTLIQMGAISGELSQAKCIRTYGEWFKEAIAVGKISPCRIGLGSSGTKWYSIQDILALKATEYRAMEDVIAKM